MIMQGHSVAVVKISCESVVGGYEDHFHKEKFEWRICQRGIWIAVNGPNIANSDSAIKEAMNRHWEGGCWEFS